MFTAGSYHSDEEKRFQEETFGDPRYRFITWVEDGLSEDDCWDHYYQLFEDWRRDCER